MMLRAHITVHGKVQGVFFRKHAQEKAEKMGVNGYVCNDGDGTVSIVAEGAENQLNELIEWCHSGPSMAQVSKVDAKKYMFTGEFEDFSIRY